MAAPALVVSSADRRQVQCADAPRPARARVRLIGYVRVSRVGGREGDSFISPAVQRQQVEAYSAAHGHELVAWFEDLDVSGAKASRPQFDLALDAIERGDADGLI